MKFSLEVKNLKVTTDESKDLINLDNVSINYEVTPEESINFTNTMTHTLEKLASTYFATQLGSSH